MARIRVVTLGVLVLAVMVAAAAYAQMATESVCDVQPLPWPGTRALAECSYTVVQTYPHDPAAYTQGLQYLDGYLYESTGGYGQFSIRKTVPASGEIIQRLDRADLAPEYFGEGITVLGDRLYQVTWQAREGFIYDRRTLELLRSFRYPTEGWGLTNDGQRLIMSDGTETIYFLDPESLAEVGRIAVHDAAGPVLRLNELEHIHGAIYANVWLTDRIARIDPQTGAVTAWIDLTGLADPSFRVNADAVLNGIAYDAAGDRLFVSGKLWPQLFEIKLRPAVMR